MTCGRNIWKPSLEVALSALMLAASAQTVLADSWLAPTAQEYLSPDKTYRFRVIPRGISSPLDYFGDKVAGRSQAGQALGLPSRCSGVLEHRKSAWRPYHVLWRRDLVNDVSPVSAVVSPDGRFIATFDNWHSTGYGPHTVVLYAVDGHLVRSLNLYDFLLREEISTLSMSVSSIHWLKEAHFEGNASPVTLVLSVEPRAGTGTELPPLLVRIDASTGMPLRSTSDLEAIGLQQQYCQPDTWQKSPVDLGCEGRHRFDTWCNLCGAGQPR